MQIIHTLSTQYPAAKTEIVLVIEPDAAVQRSIDKRLSSQFYLIWADSVSSAAEFLDKDTIPTIVVANIMTPGLCPHDLQTQLANRSIPLLLINTLSDNNTAQQNKTIADHFSEPCETYSGLQNRIQAVLENQNLRAALAASHSRLLQQLDNNTSSIKALLASLDTDWFENLIHGAVITDELGLIIACNQKTKVITGFDKRTLLGSHFLALSSLDNQNLSEAVEQDGTEATPWIGETLCTRHSGATYAELRSISVIRNHRGHIEHYISVFAERRSQPPAVDATPVPAHSGTANLSDRQQMTEHINALLFRSHKQQSFCTVLQVQLHELHQLTDNYGARTVEQTLQQAAQKILDLLEAEDRLCIINQDTLLVLLTASSDSRDQAVTSTRQLSSRIKVQMQQPFHIPASGAIRLNCSIGAVILSDQFNTTDEVIRAASLSQLSARNTNSQLVFFSEQIGTEMREGFQLQAALSNAIENNYLKCFVQPQVNAAGQLEGLETLIRYKHPQHAWLSPNRFIPLAENSDLIIKLDRWMLDQACWLISRLHRNHPEIKVSVNISTRYFETPDFVGELQKLLRKHLAAAEQLVLEITERLMIDDIDLCITKMQDVARLGVALSIDDFGTGYSSLSYLSQLPIQELKIDQCRFKQSLQHPFRSCAMES